MLSIQSSFSLQISEHCTNWTANNNKTEHRIEQTGFGLDFSERNK